VGDLTPEAALVLETRTFNTPCGRAAQAFETTTINQSAILAKTV
jgi:hypothetical protein